MHSDALKMIQAAKETGSMLTFAIVHAILMVVVSVVTLIIGAVYYGQCLIEPNISIFLIVAGITVGILQLPCLIIVSHF
jgi:hypothetical protein